MNVAFYIIFLMQDASCIETGCLTAITAAYSISAENTGRYGPALYLTRQIQSTKQT